MEAVVFLVVIIWISLCFVAGAITKNKGNSFIAAFLISLVISPSLELLWRWPKSRTLDTGEARKLSIPVPKVISIKHIYEVRPRKDHRGVDLIGDALPFGRSRAAQRANPAGI